ncbi:MAG: DUF1638 domain-containing protein [Methanothrix sp.]
MPTLSIISCRMLEDEIVHLLSSDSEVKELLLLDGKENQSLSRKLKSQNRPHILLAWESIGSHLQEKQSSPGGHFSRLGIRSSPAKGLMVVVSLLRLGLHSDLQLLRTAVYDEIRRMSAFSDGILIFYGRCGDFLAHIQEDLADLSCPLYFLADGKGQRIDDCIATALGGNEEYDRTLSEHKDVAVFLTPMWASSWRTMREDASQGSGRDLRAMLKGTGLKRVAKIDTGLTFEKGFGEKVDGFAREFSLERINLSGGTRVAEKSYERAKSSLLAAETARTPLPDRSLPLQSSWPKEPILSFCGVAWKRIAGFSSRQKE